MIFIFVNTLVWGDTFVEFAIPYPFGKGDTFAGKGDTFVGTQLVNQTGKFFTSCTGDRLYLPISLIDDRQLVTKRPNKSMSKASDLWDD